MSYLRVIDLEKSLALNAWARSQYLSHRSAQKAMSSLRCCPEGERKCVGVSVLGL